MIKKIVIYFMVIVGMSIEIESNVCRYPTIKTVNETISYPYSYLVKYFGECNLDSYCLLSRWETRVMNKTIEKRDFIIERRCCPGWRDISTNKTRRLDNDQGLVCVRNTECIGSGPCTMQTTYNATRNGTSMIDKIMWRSKTTSVGPQYANNDSVPYHWRYTTSTERNNNHTVPYYRRYSTTTERNYNNTVPYHWWYTTSTERNYNDTIPYYRRYTTSTERNYNDTVPYHWWYTTSTERNYNDTIPYYRRYTTSTERNYNNTVPYHWWYTTSTERNNDTVPYYRRYTTSTERNYNNTVPYHWWYTTSTEGNNDTIPYYPRYTNSTERPRVRIYYDDVNYEDLWDKAPASNISTNDKVSFTDSNATKVIASDNWGDTPTRVRNLNKTESASTNFSIPSSNTEWNKNNSGVSYGTDTTSTKDRTSNNTELNPINNTVNYSIGSLPDISEPYRPYNWNNTTYKRNTPTDANLPFTYTTSAIDDASKDNEKKIEPMCPRQRWIWILTSIILAFTALCVTLLVWRVISLKKYQNRGRRFVNQGPVIEKDQDMYNATYTSTETKAKINNIYPSTSDI